MSSGTLQWSIFIGLTALVAALTWWRCRGAQHSNDASREYFLAGGGLTWPIVAGSLLLTNISAEQIVGMNGAQMALVAWWEFGAAVALIVLAKVLVPLYYKYRCTTTTELLEHRFGDSGIRAGVGLLFLFGYQFILLPVVLYTGAVFMKSMFGLEFSVLGIAAALAAAGLAYAAFGGLRAIAISDTFNGVGLLVMGLIVTAFAMSAIDWDLSGMPAERFTLIGGPDSDIRRSWSSRKAYISASAVAPEAPGLAAVAGFHVGAEHHRQAVVVFFARRRATYLAGSQYCTCESHRPVPTNIAG
jgi:solute:Na+ symporter, SSS family